ncbi:MAG: hypothetical protein JSS50_03145 [Proteobacteria bacterium]|nr:hypothetical protein [Pseudomonadota bacterium]
MGNCMHRALLFVTTLILFIVQPIAGYTDEVCSIANLSDSYVLAASWQPGFCKGHADKQECKAMDKYQYAGSNFTLHGLWPNKTSCGKTYGFCDRTVVAEPAEPGHFCDLPTLNWSDSTKEYVQKYMPSVQHGTCLERHEWWKHGTCSGYSVDEYFTISVSLLDQLNSTEFADFIRSNIGKVVARNQLYAAFDQSFGYNARKRLTLSCQGRKGALYLQEIQMQLPSPIDPNVTLAEMLQTGKEAKNTGNCGDTFTISEVQNNSLVN